METTSETRHGRYGRPEGVKHLIHYFFRTLHRRRWLRELSVSRPYRIFCMESASETRHGRYGRTEVLIHHFFRSLHRRCWLHEHHVFNIGEFAWKTVAKNKTEDTEFQQGLCFPHTPRKPV